LLSDILAQLPPELSIYLLRFLDLPSIIACLSVSKSWRACAEDNDVWRELFYRKDGWNIDFRKVKHSLNGRSKGRPSAVPIPISSTVTVARLAPLSLHWRSLYKSRLELDKRWVTGEATVTRIAGHSDSVYCLEFDSKRIVTGSRDRTVKVWSLETGKFIASFRGHAGSVLCLKFDKEWDAIDPDAHGFMVTGSSDYSVMVWDLYAGGSKAEVKAILNGHTGGVLDLRIDNDYIVSW
jgi:F-box and WD-40 domain protein 1/11